MKRISIDRIVIDAGFLEGRDPSSFREQLQGELTALLANGFDPQTPLTRAHVDGGQLAPGKGTTPRAVAEHIARTLGGKA